MSAQGTTTDPPQDAAGLGADENASMQILAGADANAPSLGGPRPLHGAAERGREVAIQLLLAAAANVNVRDDLGWQPLLAAGANDRIARHLIAAGADVDSDTAAVGDSFRTGDM